MLNKIKVYRRSDAKEIYNSDDDFFALCFKKNGEIWLQYRQLEKLGVNVKLTKTDPLNKFKKEMEGWWFCEEYVVIENDKYAILECEVDYNAMRSIFLPSDAKVYMHIKFQGKTIKSLCSNVDNEQHTMKALWNISKELYPHEKIVDGYKFVIPYCIAYNPISIGEDKYIKLLELINQ